jgi:hypothetical protein
MRRKIIAIIFLLLFLLLFTSTSFANSGPGLQVGVFGTSLLTGLKRAGSVIYNNGDEDVLDITFTFSVIGGYDDSINKIILGEIEILQPNTSYLITTNKINGFGPVIISNYVDSSNSGMTEEVINGFQLGSFTITQPYFISWY